MRTFQACAAAATCVKVSGGSDPRPAYYRRARKGSSPPLIVFNMGASEPTFKSLPMDLHAKWWIVIRQAQPQALNGNVNSYQTVRHCYHA